MFYFLPVFAVFLFLADNYGLRRNGMRVVVWDRGSSSASVTWVVMSDWVILY